MRNLLSKTKESVEILILVMKLLYTKASLRLWTVVERWSKKQLEAEWCKRFRDNK